MRTLAIETATQACSVALFDAASLIAHDHRVLGRGHAEALVPMIADLPDKGKAARILVSRGPGSFTGVRIGIATARALGVAWGAQVLGYSTLKLIAQSAQQIRPEPVTVCMNGGHGEWFIEHFSATGESEGAGRSLAPDQVRANGTHRFIAGDRAAPCADLFADGRKALDLLPDASKSIALASADLVDDLSPIYGRAPDATPQRAAPL